jgi:hypothetical protein
MVERVFGAIFENVTSPIQSWGLNLEDTSVWGLKEEATSVWALKLEANSV